VTARWPTSKLRDVADVRVSSVDKKSHASELPIKLCNYMEVYANDYVTSSLDFMPATASPSEIERFALHAGDVVITKDSETPDDIGVPAVIVEDIDGLVCGYHLALIRPTARVHPTFLAQQLASTQAIKYFAANATGSTRFGLAIGTIEEFDIPTPPLREQAKIAEVLSTVDRAIEQTEALIAKQQRIKTGFMQDLLTRGVDEHDNLRSEATHKFKDSPLGRIPVEWVLTKIGDQFAERKGSGRPGLPVMSIVMNVGLVKRSSVDRRVQTALAPEQHALVCEGDITYNMMRMWQGVL
jgi:type I restriction enzyme S subunit